MKNHKPKHMRKAPKGYPVLRGFTSGDRKMINVFCPFCDRYHYHGWTPETPSWAVEHRSPHCAPRNETFEKGYFIGEITTAKLRGTYR